MRSPYMSCNQHTAFTFASQEYISLNYATFFFRTPRRIALITVPTTSASRYISGLPTTGNTKIPPCGAINVHWNAIDNAPAAAEPMIHAGSTWIGSAAANGIEPSVINARPIIKLPSFLRESCQK